MNCKKTLNTKNILLILFAFTILGYILNKYFVSKRFIEGNRNRCGKKKTWCEVKKKCVSIWSESCDAKV